MTQINREKELQAVNLLWNPVWAEDASEITSELITVWVTGNANSCAPGNNH